MNKYFKLYEGAEFYDDLSGARLDKEGVVKGRALEMAFFKELGVYRKIK